MLQNSEKRKFFHNWTACDILLIGQRTDKKFSANDAKLAQLSLEKGESAKKIAALESAYKQLKDKHMKLVEAHANLLRQNAAVQAQTEKLKVETTAIKGRFLLDSLL